MPFLCKYASTCSRLPYCTPTTDTERLWNGLVLKALKRNGVGAIKGRAETFGLSQELSHLTFVYVLLFVISETEKHRDEGREAAITIQKNWRMLKIKWSFEQKVRACVKISRVWRGHFTRLRVNDRLRGEYQQRQMAFYGEMAKIIQKL